LIEYCKPLRRTRAPHAAGGGGGGGGTGDIIHETERKPGVYYRSELVARALGYCFLIPENVIFVRARPYIVYTPVYVPYVAPVIAVHLSINNSATARAGGSTRWGIRSAYTRKSFRALGAVFVRFYYYYTYKWYVIRAYIKVKEVRFSRTYTVRLYYKPVGVWGGEGMSR